MSARLLLVGAGLLLGVLWMDLMFDVQALGAPDGELPEAVLASISAYYRRVTTDASPMGRLVGLVMAGTLAASLVRALYAPLPAWRRWLPAALVGAAMSLALARVFPNAVALGTRAGTPLEQSRLARSILHDHLACLAGMAAGVGLVLPGSASGSAPGLRRPGRASGPP